MVLMGALSASLVMAYRVRPHPTLRQFRAILFDNWSMYGLFQLNVGLLLAAAWIFCVHRRKSIALLWVLGVALLGHIATIAYLLVRAASARTLNDILLPQAAPVVENPAAPVIQACDPAFNVELPEPTDSAAPPDVVASQATVIEETA